MVTANGRPSGTATTNTVIPVIKYRTNRLQYLLLQRSRLGKKRWDSVLILQASHLPLNEFFDRESDQEDQNSQHGNGHA